ncbi:MAG TPA: hypothetical protein VGR78_01835 [Verrucomicrobiae bacterium]|nr:hypothetical protein [Verrucomicrobiae bacterium]
MKYSVLFGAAALFSLSIIAADSGPKDEVINAAKQLGEKENYSWRTTVKVPESAQFRPGPTEGKTEKGGSTVLKMTFRDNDVEAVLKGDKGALHGENGWESVSELENAEGRGRFMGAMLRNFKVPTEQAAELAKETKELKKDGDSYSGELTAEGAKALMRFRRGGDGPEASGAKGHAKFWVKDGVLNKYEFHVQGSMNFNGNDVDVDRTTTVEIKDIGSTKVEVPEGARKKLS